MRNIIEIHILDKGFIIKRGLRDEAFAHMPDALAEVAAGLVLLSAVEYKREKVIELLEEAKDKVI